MFILGKLTASEIYNIVSIYQSHRTTLHTKNNKRGISPAVAAIILIVAAVVIGVLVVMYATGLFKSTTTAPQIMARNIALYCSGTDFVVYATFEVLKGTAKFDSNTLKVCVGTSCASPSVSVISSSTGSTSVPLVLSAGQTATLKLTVSSKNVGKSCSPSEAYLVTIYYQGQTVYRGQLVAQSGG
jgi:hypothetical protein